MDIDDKIAKINDRLKTALIRVRLRRKGDKLYLRATYPPKPQETEPKQRDLSLGVNATAEGLKFAEAKAKEIGGLLDSDRFSWDIYLDTKEPRLTEGRDIAYWVESFEQHYFESRPRTPSKENTYYKHYKVIFNHLPQYEQLSEGLLKKFILNRSEPGTCSRGFYVRACQSLATFAGLECDFSNLKGDYSITPIDSRDLPSDEQIIYWHSQIDNPNWRWAYGILATYGIRPHELFHLDCSRLNEPSGVLQVSAETKSQRSRICYPCPSKWKNEFILNDVRVPVITGKNNNRMGGAVSQYFRRRGIPFTPYYLRHAYAARTAALGVDVAISSKWMGHSVQIHCQVYHAFLDERHHRQAFELMRKMEDLL